MLRTVCLISFLSLLSLQIFGQTKSLIHGTKLPIIYIRNITISGNEKTEESVIRRELTIVNGDTFKLSQVAYDKSRVYSLGLFNKVDFTSHEAGDDSVDVSISVIERWYIFPFPLFGFHNGDWNKLYYGGGLIQTTFRGRNEKLVGSFTIGYNPYLDLYYLNPNIKESSELFFETRFFAQRLHSRSIVSQQKGNSYEEKHYSSYMNFGKRYDLFRRLSFGMEFNSVNISKYKKGRTISNNGKDNYFSLKFAYSYDSRDLTNYTLDGLWFRTSFSKVGLSEQSVNFTRISFDVRKYILLKIDTTISITTAARFFSTISSGKNLPEYEHVFFGYGERLRGYGFKIFEGDNLAGTSLEFRIPILAPRIYHLSFIPISQFAYSRFGMYAALFGNVGAVQYQSLKLSEYNFAKGYGLGLHFILPYDFVMRAEIAWNEFHKSELIVDLGSSF